MRARAWCLGLGVASLAIALLPPLHHLSEERFAAHMVQHELLMALAAPLLVAGYPLAAIARRLPRRTQRGLARADWRRELEHLWHLLTRPGIAFTLQAVAIWAWHVPALFNASVTHPAVHALQHASFFGTAILFWASVLRPHRGGEGVAVMSLFLTSLHTTILGALIALAGRPWYGAYAGGAEAHGFSLLADQQLGGYIMWMPGGTSYAVAAFVLVSRWLAAPKRRTVSAILGVAAVVLLAGCGRPSESLVDQRVGGDEEQGRAVLAAWGCGTCHTIPGVPRADGLVGPSLAGFGARAYVGGVLTNTPEHVSQWIRNPRSQSPRTAMPALGVSESDARQMAAYLMTLR
jgi:cytochrome c oxidase assembly factor CtaG/cytochrome c2